MFSDTGFFHFVFANFDDKFYTDNLLCLNFDAYLWYMLKKDGFNSIVRLYNNGSDYTIEYTGINLENYVIPKKKGIFDKLFGKQDTAPNNPFDSTVQRNRYERLLLSDVKVRFGNLLELLLQSNQQSKTAIVMKIEVFHELCADEKNKRQFISLNKSGKRNCTILLSGTDASYCDRFFVKTAGEKGLFFDPDLFPDIEHAFYKSDTKLVFTYDVLNSALKSRMHLMNKLTEYELRNMVRYESIRSTFSERMVSSELIVALMRIWYGNNAFRKKYTEDSPFTSIPNIRRMRLDLAKVINSLKLYLWIGEVVQGEGTSDPGRLYQKWTINDRYAYIGYFTDRHIYPVIIELAEKLKNLIVTHQYRYRDNKFERLSYLIARFQEPSFQSVYLKAELPHLLFEDSGCSGTVRNLLYGLSEKREWNSWDDVSVEMLYVLFDLCLSHAESPCDRDFYNEVGRSQVTKGIEILKYYMQQSVDAPFAVENAVAESTEYERILRSGDLTNIKNMIIGNKKTF